MAATTSTTPQMPTIPSPCLFRNKTASTTQHQRALTRGPEAFKVAAGIQSSRRGHTVKHKSRDKKPDDRSEFEQLTNAIDSVVDDEVLLRLRVVDVSDSVDTLMTSDSYCKDVYCDWAISLYMYLLNNLCILMKKRWQLNDTGEDGANTSIARSRTQRRTRSKLQLSTSSPLITLYLLLLLATSHSLASPAHQHHSAPAAYDSNTFDLQPQTINLEQSIAAVFNKVAYGSTTKRSIPDSAAAGAAAYPVTTLATPLLTTYRYSDGNGEEYFRVDVKDRERDGGGVQLVPGRDIGRSSYDYDQTPDEDRLNSDNMDPAAGSNTYGADLEKDHVLPTSAPAADILKNNNNRHYDNPNRYNNDRLKPNYDLGGNNGPDSATESMYKPPFNQHQQTTTTSSNQLGVRNVRPTKSIFSKDVPSYVPPSRAFFTPPLPPEYLSPFADKPTLRGTNSDSYANRRPIPPPSIMPNKDRIPFRPDMPNKVINMDRTIITDNNNNKQTDQQSNSRNAHHPTNSNVDKPLTDSHSQNTNRKKTLNTPSQTVNVNIDRLGEFYGLNRNGMHLNNESASSSLNGGNAFEYEKTYNIPSITRILSGSNGRSDSISEILLRTVTATPPPWQHSKEQQPVASGGRGKPTRSDGDSDSDGDDDLLPRNSPKIQTQPDGGGGGGGGRVVAETSERVNVRDGFDGSTEREITHQHSSSPSSASSPNAGGIPIGSSPLHPPPLDRSLEAISTKNNFDLTTQSSEYVNLPNVKQKKANVTLATSEEIWFISWNVHVYLVVLCYVVLALFSIYKLIRYENDPHMFSKSYFLTIHLMLTVICVLRIFYLTYDPYNVDKSFNIFLYDFLHNFPLSLLATTFAVLILFLLKRTLTHLKVKTKPVFLVGFGLIHMCMCFFLSIFETLGHFDRAGLIVCKPVFVLLAWALGFSYLYLYKIIKNVLAKKSQNLSEMCTQNIGYASHITIAVALLFLVLGCVQLYALFCIKVDRFNGEIKHHWILWGFELSVRVLEISIITLLAIVVSLKLSQREKQTVGFPLFPCTTSESSSDNIYPNNCNTNPNALNYSRNEMVMENLPGEPNERPPPNERPNLLKNTFQNDSFEKKSTLERYPASGAEAESTPNQRFERPKWTHTSSERFESFRSGGGAAAVEQVAVAAGLNNFDRVLVSGGSGSGSGGGGGSNTSGRSSSGRKYYAKPKYDVEYNNEDYQHDGGYAGPHHVHQNSHSSSHSTSSTANTNPPPTTTTQSTDSTNNVYSEPLDTHQPHQQHQYERTRHEFERSDVDRRSRSSGTSNGGGGSGGTSGRRSTTGRSRSSKYNGRDGGHVAGDVGGSGRRYGYGAGMQTLPAGGGAAGERSGGGGRGGREETMLVDDQGFLRFRHMQDLEYNDRSKRSHKQRPSMNDVNHYSDA